MSQSISKKSGNKLTSLRGRMNTTVEASVTSCSVQMDLERGKRHLDETEDLEIQQRFWEREKQKYNRDVTLPITDDVAILIGKMRELAFVQRVAGLNPLLTQLENAIEVQMVSFFEAMRDTGPSIVEPLKPYLKSGLVLNAVRSALASDKADEEKEKALLEQDSPRVVSSLINQFPESTRIDASKRGRSASSKRCSVNGRPLSPPSIRHISDSVNHSVNQQGSAVGGAPARDKSMLFAPMMTLVAESLARTTRCEVGHVYMLGSDDRNLECVGKFPPLMPDEELPKLARPLVSAVHERGMGVSGIDQQSGHGLVDLYQKVNLDKPPAGPSGRKATAAGSNNKNTLDGDSGCRNCLVWPIKGVINGRQIIVGALEMINKVKLTEDHDATKFSSEDEIFAHSTAKLIGSLMKPYGYKVFSKNVASAVFSHSMTHGPGCLGSPEVVQLTRNNSLSENTNNTYMSGSSGENTLADFLPIHIPRHIELPLRSADIVSKEVEACVLPTFVYRGPMKMLHRAGEKGVVVGSGSMDGFGTGASLDLRSVEGTLDSLNDMWHRSYEENVNMHQQCRRWATKLRDLNQVVSALQGALMEARDIETLDEVRAYLRVLELSFKSGSPASSAEYLNKATNQRQIKTASSFKTSSVSAVVAENTTTSSNSNPQRSVSIRPPARVGGGASSESQIKKTGNDFHEMYIDGAEGVRTYTVDAETKLAQQEAIGRHMAQFDIMKAEEQRRAFAAVPHSQTLTSSSILHATKPPQAYLAINQANQKRSGRKGLDQLLPNPSPLRMGSAPSSGILGPGNATKGPRPPQSARR